MKKRDIAICAVALVALTVIEGLLIREKIEQGVLETVSPWAIWFMLLVLLGFAGFWFATWKTDDTPWRSLTLGGWALFGSLSALPFAASLALIVAHI